MASKTTAGIGRVRTQKGWRTLSCFNQPCIINSRIPKKWFGHTSNGRNSSYENVEHVEQNSETSEYMNDTGLSMLREFLLVGGPYWCTRSQKYYLRFIGGCRVSLVRSKLISFWVMLPNQCFNFYWCLWCSCSEFAVRGRGKCLLVLRFRFCHQHSAHSRKWSKYNRLEGKSRYVDQHLHDGLEDLIPLEIWRIHIQPIWWPVHLFEFFAGYNPTRAKCCCCWWWWCLLSTPTSMW